MLGLAVRVVGKNLDHPARCNSTARALPYHSSEFTAQRLQYGDALFDLIQMVASDSVRMGARLLRMGGQREQTPDLIYLEPQIPCMPYKSQGIGGATIVTPLVSFGTVWRRQQVN
jgi:hypothetical protein